MGLVINELRNNTIYVDHLTMYKFQTCTKYPSSELCYHAHTQVKNTYPKAFFPDTFTGYINLLLVRYE